MQITKSPTIAALQQRQTTSHSVRPSLQPLSCRNSWTLNMAEQCFYLFEMPSSSLMNGSSSNASAAAIPSSSTSSPSNELGPTEINDIIELFEDVEGITIKPFEEWKFSQYFVTTDQLIQPIFAAKRIAVGSKFYPVIECPKIIVQSKGGEDLEPQVVVRVMFRSCGFTLLCCVKEEPAPILKFYCPLDVLEKLCQVEHRVKGKDVLVLPDTSCASIPPELQQQDVGDTVMPPKTEIAKEKPPLLIVEPHHSQNSPCSIPHPSPSTQAVERPFPVPTPEPTKPKSEEYSVSIIHDGQHCPANRFVTPSQLRDGILNLVWKALTGRSEMVQQDELSIFVKWNFILSPTRIHQHMPPADSTFYKDLVPLGARLIDPGPCSKGVKNMFLEILSDYLSSFSSRSSKMNHHEVVLLICHADQDYVDIVRLMRNLGAKVMLIYSEVVWNETNQRFQSLAGGSKMGLRAILPRHYVLGVWEDITGDSAKIRKESHAIQDSSVTNLVQEKSSSPAGSSPNSQPPTDQSSNSAEYPRKRHRDDLIPSSIASGSKIRGVQETYGSRNCAWCLEYYGDNCMVHGKSGHTSRDCWFNPKKKNVEECCAWCMKYTGRKYRHKTINCWNLECPWCRKHNDERCFHHIENCPKVKQSKERREKSNSSSKQPSKSKEATSSPQPKTVERLDAVAHYKDNISVIDECWKDDMEVAKSPATKLWIEDRLGNRKEDPTEVPRASTPSSACSWCLEFLSMDLDHPTSACPYQHSKKAANGCLWCFIHLGVKLAHDLSSCPNRLEKQMKDQEPIEVMSLDLTASSLAPTSTQTKPKSPRVETAGREIRVKLEHHHPEKKMKILDPRLRMKVEKKSIKEMEVGEVEERVEQKSIKETDVVEPEERAPDSCEWCWTIRRVQTVHGLDECDLAPRPKGNTKPTSLTITTSSPPPPAPPLEDPSQDMELDDSIQWGDEDHCVRCWDNIRMRRYHAFGDCPFAPTPKGNEKPCFPINEEFDSEPIDSDQVTISFDRTPAPPPTPSPSPPVIKEEANLSSTNVQQTPKAQLEICQLCWEHHRQRKYHDHPSDCRTIHKIRKNHKKWT
jgi:hypothetical protein